MLGLQAAYSGSPEVGRIFKDTVARIQAMALVHQKLCQAQDLSKIDLQDYIRDLTDLLFKSYNTQGDKIRLELDVAPLTVLIDIAVPCGLITNELVVNSLKYAFVGREHGVISLMISAEDDTIVMDYVDDGVGVPDNFDFRGRKSLGLQSIFALAEQQLQGRGEFRNRPGLGCKITFVNRVYQSRI
ncbi:MAG: sensor histidine kinase [Kiritimatiellia bacterium]